MEQTFQISVESLRDESTETSSGVLAAAGAGAGPASGGGIEGAGDKQQQRRRNKSPVVSRLVELKPGGAGIAVRASNCHEFVELYCSYLLERSVAAQLQPFRSGFLEVVGGRVVSLCSAEELSLMTNGYPLAAGQGLKELEAVTQYVGGYTKDSPTVRWFWQAVHRASDEWRRSLLAFTTGTDRLPILGLRSVKFVIQVGPRGRRGRLGGGLDWVWVGGLVGRRFEGRGERSVGNAQWDVGVGVCAVPFAR